MFITDIHPKLRKSKSRLGSAGRHTLMNTDKDQYILTFEEIRRIFLIWNETKREQPDSFDEPPPSNKIDYESRQAEFFLMIHRGEFPIE